MKLPFFFRLLAPLGCSLLFVQPVSAQTVSIHLTASRLYDASGVKLATDSLVLLVADTTGGGFGSVAGGSDLAVGSFLNTSMQILGRTMILANGTGTAFASFDDLPLGSAPFANLGSGDPLGLVWFSTLTGSSGTALGGAQYGFFTSLSSSIDGDAWVVPGAGDVIDIFFKTAVAGGTHAETDAYATLTVTAVPEPATYAASLAIVAFAAAALRRRRRALPRA